jgi:hypothetical protein
MATKSLAISQQTARLKRIPEDVSPFIGIWIRQSSLVNIAHFQLIISGAPNPQSNDAVSQSLFENRRQLRLACEGAGIW